MQRTREVTQFLGNEAIMFCREIEIIERETFNIFEIFGTRAGARRHACTVLLITNHINKWMFTIDNNNTATFHFSHSNSNKISQRAANNTIQLTIFLSMSCFFSFLTFRFFLFIFLSFVCFEIN